VSDVIEIMALAILNSDREAHGWPPVASRENIPDSEGYVRNARDVIAALADTGLAVVPVEPTEAMLTAGQDAWLDDPARRSSTLYRAMIESGKVTA
jgi:hypothetical protein